MSPTISIIIPCYNSGKYLIDAIDSVERFPDKSIYEIVIINDGSTDKETLKIIDQLKRKSYTILTQENKGPAAARNTGIRNSKGKYLLFLDSDNIIRTSYIYKGIEILSKNEEIGVVYGNPLFFGENTGDFFFMPKEFDLNSILHSNYIDTCTVIRRKVWEDIGGFDENRELTQEDWEFWIRVGKSKWKFFHINEIMFEYRVRFNSHVSATHNNLNYKKLLRYIYSKHIDLFIDNYLTTFAELEKYKTERRRPIHTLAKYLYKRVLERKSSFITDKIHQNKKN